MIMIDQNRFNRKNDKAKTIRLAQSVRVNLSKKNENETEKKITTQQKKLLVELLLARRIRFSLLRVFPVYSFVNIVDKRNRSGRRLPLLLFLLSLKKRGKIEERRLVLSICDAQKLTFHPSTSNRSVKNSLVLRREKKEKKKERTKDIEQSVLISWLFFFCSSSYSFCSNNDNVD